MPPPNVWLLHYNIPSEKRQEFFTKKERKESLASDIIIKSEGNQMTYHIKQLIFHAVENCKDIDLLDLIYKILAESEHQSEVE